MRRLTMLATMLALAGLATSIYGGEAEDAATRGKGIYGIYCKSCHGERADGGVPEARGMEPRPADLTRLSLGNGGEFPTERVYRTIDGRDLIAGHGPSEMPVWGLTFQELDRDVDQEDQVRRKILDLIAYIEAVQRAEP